MSDHYYKRMYSAKEFYRFLYEFLRTVKFERHAKKSGELDKDFFERIMFAVTEVNGCELCSYKHTEDALKNGMKQEEINQMLSGSSQGIPEEESIGIFFAQHYAEKKGKPTKESWQRLVDTYGQDKSKAILGAVRGIMMGNTHGIAVGALVSRLKGKKIQKSNLAYEIVMILSVIPFLPIAFIHSIIANIINIPLIRF